MHIAANAARRRHRFSKQAAIRRGLSAMLPMHAAGQPASAALLDGHPGRSWWNPQVVITEEGERQTIVDVACRSCGHRIGYHVRWDLDDERDGQGRVETRCPGCGVLMELWYPIAAYDRPRRVM
jgi:hypothetical protein